MTNSWRNPAGRQVHKFRSLYVRVRPDFLIIFVSTPQRETPPYKNMTRNPKRPLSGLVATVTQSAGVPSLV